MIYALTITPTVQVWMANTTAVSLLHRFDHACNLVNQTGDLLSLVTPDVGPGPFAVVLPIDAFPRDIDRDTVVQIHQTVLSVGSIQVDIKNAKVWQSRPPWHRLHKTQNAWRRTVCRWEESVAAYREHALQGQTAVFAHQRLLEQSFIAAIQNNQPEQGRHMVIQLAGLGAGLTPAGDDFLMGVLYGLRVVLPDDEARRWAGLIVETAVPRTTSLSGAWLKAAAQGEAGAAWHQLVAALVADGVEVETAVSCILNTGHSSGSDALMGFLSVLCK